MSPLDDQLRAAMHARASVLTPAPDPLAGIESRARGMKRRRVAASVVGAALAVAAIAVAVPSLQSSPGKAPSQVATPGPTLSTDPAALDPARPWAFRGTPLAAGTRDAFQREWAVRHPGSTLTVLFSQVYEPSGQEQAAFVATGDGTDRVGFVTSSESGPEFLYDEAYATPATALQFALPGDEVPRLAVVSAPTASEVFYSATGDPAQERDISVISPRGPGGNLGPRGIGLTALEGDLSRDRVRVVIDARVVYDEPARDPSGGVGPITIPGSDPANVLDWPTRGAMENDLVAKLPEIYAPSLGGDASKVAYKVLFAGDTDSRVRFVMGQIWAAGDREAHSFAYAEGGTNGPSVFFGPVTAPTAKVLAFLVDSLPGTSVDLLVVIPHPRTTQVLYDDNGSGDLRPVSDTPGADGVALVDRSRTASADRLQLLTGNGDPATDTTFQGPVASLLCGSKSCG